MGKKSMIIGLVCVFFLTAGSILSAHYVQSVLKTDMGDASQVVATRKFLMQAVRGNMIDMNQKLKAGNIKDAALNGTSIAALATLLPPLYKEVHKDLYPFEGSKTYFKGAAPAAFESAADKMRAAGMDIKNAAEKGDQAGVKAGLGALKSSCGGCHSAFRGKY